MVHRPWFADPCSKINTALVHLTKQDPNNCIPGGGKKKNLKNIFRKKYLVTNQEKLTSGFQMNYFLHKIRNKARMSSFLHCTGGCSKCNKARKKNKRHPDRNKDVKLHQLRGKDRVDQKQLRVALKNLTLNIKKPHFKYGLKANEWRKINHSNSHQKKQELLH